jgi:predicted DNA-binding transcriptional regulator AlpA
MATPEPQHDPHYTDSELAPLIGLARTTLQQMRVRTPYVGPPYVRVGGRAVRYRWSEVQRWLDGRRVGGR